MYTKEQEEMALREYERLGSITAVIHRLGYPSESTLYRWYERKKAGLENRHAQIAETTVATGHHCNTPGHPRHPSAAMISASMWAFGSIRGRTYGCASARMPHGNL